MMSAILEALPGLPLSVREVTRQMIHMWDQQVGEEGPPISDFRASQMNLVLHFGPETSVDEAKHHFDQSIAFAQRYPCRIVVLVETAASGEDEALQGKLFSQCYVGRDLRDLCCCEALMMSYPQQLAHLVAHQASLWLEADLPVYYWLHRESEEIADASFGALLKQARRVIFDRSIDDDRYSRLTVSSEERRHDLAYARTLRLRQSLGQFASSYSPEELAGDLQRVEVECGERVRGEAAVLLDWTRNALNRCARLVDCGECPEYELKELPSSAGESIRMKWQYGGKETKSFEWEYTPGTRSGHVSAKLGTAPVVRQPIHIEPLSDAQALAEALFFGSVPA